MRALVFLLILANLLFFAWTQGFLGNAANPDALRLQQQLLADRVRVVARDEPPETAKPVKADKQGKPERADAEACLLFADLPVAELARVEGLASEKFPAFRPERAMTPASNYWVYIPPQPSKQDAERKAAELKKFKVPEFFIVQDAGEMRFSISLGIFSSREAAEERLEELRNKGVRSAKVGERDIKPTHGALALYGPEAQSEALRQAFTEWLPKSKPVPCKASKPGAP